MRFPLRPVKRDEPTEVRRGSVMLSCNQMRQPVPCRRCRLTPERIDDGTFPLRLDPIAGVVARNGTAPAG